MLDIDVPKPMWVSFKILRDIIPKDSINKICSFNNFDYDSQADKPLPSDQDVCSYNRFLFNISNSKLPAQNDDFEPFNLSLNNLQINNNTQNVFQSLNEIRLEDITN